MTKEEKQLLLKDLCARLPYGIKCNVPFNQNIKQLIRIECDKIDGNLLLFDRDVENTPCECYLSEVKPYLRPLTSMTEEEKKEWVSLRTDVEKYYRIGHDAVVDFYNEHHLDYRGLITVGLALEAPEGMYNN